MYMDEQEENDFEEEDDLEEEFIPSPSKDILCPEKNPSYTLDKMSDEQYEIFKVIESGSNVIVDACAGSGKSTTILSVTQQLPSKKFIQLTYNSMLCSEIKTKKENLKLDNLNVFTYHSLIVKYYSSDAYTDTALRRILYNKIPPRVPIPAFDILVIDEAQDMTFLYFKIIIKFCRDIGKPVQLFILGDYMQGLYQFKGADTRFLTNAQDIWSHFELLSSPHFMNCTLKMSYRITHQMADYVNNVMLGEQRLYACREGNPVVHIKRPIHAAEKFVVHNISELIHSGNAKPSDFFILGGSVKGENSAIKKMENALVEKKIPCHVPMFETDKIDERVIEGKVVFSTFHSVKGRQRKYVFIFGFDNSYFNYYGKDLPRDKCPNTLYVACTRATHGLYLIENDQFGDYQPLPFLKMSQTEISQQPYIVFKGYPQTHFPQSHSNSRKEKIPTHYVTPTDLIKFIPESIIEDISPILDSIFINITPEDPTEISKIGVAEGVENPTNSKGSPKEIDIPSVVPLKSGFYEDVSDLNGITIPLIYCERINRDHSIDRIPTIEDTIENGGFILKNIIDGTMNTMDSHKHSFLRKIIQELPEHCNTISEYLYLSNVYVSTKEKLYFKLCQIEKDEYDWLSTDTVNTCLTRMHETFHHEIFYLGAFRAESEKTIISRSDELSHVKIDAFLRDYFPNVLFRFTARVDLITFLSVWEIKCTSSLNNEHFLQVVIYAWLWRMVMEDMENLDNVLEFKIFNIKTGEIYRLDATTEQLHYIMIQLLKGKYGKKEINDDVSFIQECEHYISQK